MRCRHDRSQAGNEQRHRGKGGHIDQKGGADRQTGTQQLGYGGESRSTEALEDSVAGIIGLPRAPAPGQQRGHPGNCRRRGGKPGCTQTHTEDVQHVERNLRRQANQVEGHDDPRPTDAGLETVEHAERQCRHQAPGQRRKVGAYLCFNRGRQVR